MKRILAWYFSPLFFGIAFIGPLVAQSLVALEISTPVQPIIVGMLLGTGLGLMAQLRGSWLWIRP